MEPNFRNDIKPWLDNLEVQHPIPTGVKTRIIRKKPVKAFIFDIYGTLIISSSGDIDQATLSVDHMKQALLAGGFSEKELNPVTCTFLLEQLPIAIKSNQEEIKKLGHPFPDVNIFKVWQEMLAEAAKNNWLSLDKEISYTDIIFVFEVLSNRVYPMPGMKEVLQDLKEKGLPLGIVSNAQFYTPVIMNYFLTGNISTRQEIEGFDKDLSVFSYKELRAKPDTLLFSKIIASLKNKYALAPENAVFVGNDMLKDVYTASKNGLQTALFTGDKRSLRTREDDERVNGILPDYYINDLKQLEEIL
jgi:putative hydrolase of the HAD superfamily